MDKGQKIRAGLGVRLVLMIGGFAAIYGITAYLNNVQKQTTPDDVKTLADQKVDRFYVEGDAKPLTGMQKPVGDAPVSGQVTP